MNKKEDQVMCTFMQDDHAVRMVNIYEEIKKQSALREIQMRSSVKENGNICAIFVFS